MRTLLRLSLLSLALAAAPALAGEKFIGKIVSAAGADTTNATTAAPFVIPFSQKLTIWCDATAYVAVDTATAASSTSGALPVTALEKLPTSTGSSNGAGARVIAISGAFSAEVRIAGPAAVTCYVSTRLGTE